jgi:hypothetical protein
VGNPVINYYNALLEADIPCYPKMALLVLIKNMDYNTRQTYIGQKKIAAQMGASYRTARRAVDELEERRLINFLGMRQIHPGTADSTQIFEILIKPLETDEHQYPYGLPVASQASPDRPNRLPVAREADNLNSSVERVGSSPEGKLSGADITGTVLYRDDDDKSKTTDKTEKNNPVQGRYSDEEIEDLVTLWGHIGLTPDDEAEATIRSTSSHFLAAHLAVLMMFAFRLSNWWNKVENWKTGCDMASFLVAAGKIDDQFGRWRNGVRDTFLRKFPTVKSVCDHLAPPPDEGDEDSSDGSLLSPEDVCEDDQHIWEDYSHAVQQCSVCGKFRSNPIVNRWTAADDLEAEYMEMVEFYDPYEQRPSEEEIASLEAQHRRATEHERNCDWTEAQPIVNRLRRTARLLDCRGYGNAVLLFSDGTFVHPVDFDPEPIEQVDTLLLAGERPMGILAPLRDRKGEPYIEPWQSDDDAVWAQLHSWAQFHWHHRM